MDELELAIYELINQQKEVTSALSSVNAEDFKKEMLSKIEDIIGILSTDDKDTSNSVYEKAYSNIGIDRGSLREAPPSDGLKTELSLLEEILYELKNIKSSNSLLATEFFGAIDKQEAAKDQLPSVKEKYQGAPDTDVKKPKQEAEDRPEESATKGEKETYDRSYIEKTMAASEEIKTLVQLLPASISSVIKEMNSSSEIREYINSNKELLSSNIEIINSIQKEVFNIEKNNTHITDRNSTYAHTTDRGQTNNNVSTTNNTSNVSSMSNSASATSIDNREYNNTTNKQNTSYNTQNNDNSDHVVSSKNMYQYDNTRSEGGDVITRNTSIEGGPINSAHYDMRGPNTSIPTISIPRDSKDVQTSESVSTSNSYTNNTVNNISDSRSELRTKDAIPPDIKVTLKSEKAIEDLVNVMKDMPAAVAAAVSSSMTNVLKSSMQGSYSEPLQPTSYPSLDSRYKS